MKLIEVHGHMETFGYGKSEKITLVGFVIFSLVVIWLVNVHYNGEKNYKQSAMDIKMDKEILMESQSIDEILKAMHNNLMVQKEWLKKLFSEENGQESDLISLMTYIPNDQVSIINSNAINDKKIGNIILKGNYQSTNSAIKTEINKLDDFFKLENILDEQMNFEMSSIYYSNNQYVTYFPYVELAGSNIDYASIFSSVDNLINKIQTLQKESPNFNIENGWDKSSVDNTSSQNINFSTAMPVVIDGKINGILTGTINEDVISNVFSDNDFKADFYLIDDTQAIIYSNNHRIKSSSSLNDAFAASYNNMNYYINKFPTKLEIRYEKDYILYITNLEKQGWQLIYVVNRNDSTENLKIIISNILLFIMVAGIIYYTIMFSRKRKNNFESIIKDSKHDSMTELLNHKNIMEALKKHVKNRRIKRLAIMMMDLDDFKKVNDAFGHSVGDDVIRVCSSTIKEVLKEKNNVAGRYGGEEFLSVITGIEAEEANNLAGQIREQFHDNVMSNMGLDVTISIGLYFAMKPFDLDAEGLVEKADKNLYKAKESGKNRVHFTSF